MVYLRREVHAKKIKRHGEIEHKGRDENGCNRDWRWEGGKSQNSIGSRPDGLREQWVDGVVYILEHKEGGRMET